MSPEEDIKQSNKQILAFYKSQGQRLRQQLKLLNSLMRYQATIINAALANGPEIKNTLKQHGIPAEVIAKCKFSANAKGIVVQFPRVTKKSGTPMTIPPFTKPTLADRQSLFKKTDEEIAKLQKDILDNKK
jgi:hypothetical protein